MIMCSSHLASARNFPPNKLPAIAKFELTVVYIVDFQSLSWANHHFMGAWTDGNYSMSFGNKQKVGHKTKSWFSLGF